MSPADQCNATTNNNDRLPTIAEPQLTTSSHNQFASLLAAAQTHFNTTKVCGIRPHSVSSGLPLMAVALSPCAMAAAFYSYYKSGLIPLNTRTNDWSWMKTECPNITQYPLRTYPCETVISKPGSLIQCTNCKKPLSVKIDAIMGPFPWCVQTTEKENNNTRYTSMGDLDHPYCSELYNMFNYTIPIQHKHNALEIRGSPRLSQVALVFLLTQNCTLPAPQGLYWVCNNSAYDFLPPKWTGKCALASVVPALRPAPLGKLVIRRAKRSDPLHTHTQTSWSRNLGALIPNYGVMAALDQVRDLSVSVESLANLTTNSITLINTQLSSTRLMVLQNRAAFVSCCWRNM